MLPRKMGPLMSHLRRLLSELSMTPPLLVEISSATVSVFVFADAGFFADDFMLMPSSENRFVVPPLGVNVSHRPFRDTKPLRLKAELRVVFHRFNASLIAE